MEDAKNLTGIITSIVMCLAVVAAMGYLILTVRRTAADDRKFNDELRARLRRKDDEGDEWKRGDDEDD